LIFPPGSRCTVNGNPVRWDVAASISRLHKTRQPGLHGLPTGAAGRELVCAVNSKAILDAEKR